MEDALCLSFLEHELEEFQGRHERSKVISILRKTWGKMSEQARTEALGLPFSLRTKELIMAALSEGNP